MNKQFISLSFFVMTMFSACDSQREKSGSKLNLTPPEWAQDAIWYQIFVERFHNGDPGNDPTPADMKHGQGGTIPASWAITPWTWDWYDPEPYLSDIPEEMDFYGKIQLRRYGGDLQGVLDKLDYLEDLGITAVYFNPLNDSPSLHKYNPRNWRHIDRNFGPDPIGDQAIIESEIPDDPTTWKFTSADLLFLKVIKEMHARGIRVIMDYSWNHVGYDFWAVEDLRKKGMESKYAEWFAIKIPDDPSTPTNEIEIEGWWDSPYMPLVRETLEDPDSRWPHEGNMTSEDVKQHIFNISRRWLDPDGDGDPSDGVDGFRLDVAAEVTLGFWREYRKVVRKVNPEAYLVGEIWWDAYPDKYMDPAPLMKGDIFDAVMNYRWYVLARGYFSQGAPASKPSEFVEVWEDLVKDLTPESQRAMMNVGSTHDTPRLSTSFFNHTPYKVKAKLNENPDYKVHRPDAETWRQVRMFLLHQYSWIGAPHIWNGDELGMWGADDPDCRKPMWWPEFDFEPEVAQAYSKRTVPPDQPKADLELRDYYKQLIRIRRENPILVNGDLEFIHANDKQMTLAYARFDDSGEFIGAFNRSEEDQDLEVSVRFQSYRNVLSGHVYRASNGKIQLNLAPIEGVLLRSE